MQQLHFFCLSEIYPQSLTALNDADKNPVWMEPLSMSFSIQSGAGMGNVMPIAK
ncbi:MAG: hypothetical protein ACI8PW_001954 [Methylophilaceae bacterium]|jgi:hypothetical protein